jgi:hypothetical protein
MPNSKHLTHDISNLVSLITKTKFGLSPSPPRKEQGPDTDLIHKQQGPPEEVHTQEGWDKGPPIQKLHHQKANVYVNERRLVESKWYTHDQFKPEN